MFTLRWLMSIKQTRSRKIGKIKIKSVYMSYALDMNWNSAIFTCINFLLSFWVWARNIWCTNGVTGCIIKTCMDYLGGDLSDIFHLSLLKSKVFTCFKRASILPIPKKRKVIIVSIITSCTTVHGDEVLWDVDYVTYQLLPYQGYRLITICLPLQQKNVGGTYGEGLILLPFHSALDHLLNKYTHVRHHCS